MTIGDCWCDFVYKTRLTLPCTNAFFPKDRVNGKVTTYYLKIPFIPISAILSQRYETKNLCGVGWGRFCTQNRIKIAWKIACVNGPLFLTDTHARPKAKRKFEEVARGCIVSLCFSQPAVRPKSEWIFEVLFWSADGVGWQLNHSLWKKKRQRKLIFFTEGPCRQKIGDNPVKDFGW